MREFHKLHFLNVMCCHPLHLHCLDFMHHPKASFILILRLLSGQTLPDLARLGAEALGSGPAAKGAQSKPFAGALVLEVLLGSGWLGILTPLCGGSKSSSIQMVLVLSALCFFYMFNANFQTKLACFFFG